MLCIKSSEVLADVRSAGWLESELHPELNRHRRHEMADICESDNIERVWRTLGVCEAEIRLALLKILMPEKESSQVNGLERPEFWTFRFLFRLPAPTASFIKEKIHEYMVATVMADRTAVIIPEASAIWQERSESALAALSQVAATTLPPLSTVCRPLWPL